MRYHLLIIINIYIMLLCLSCKNLFESNDTHLIADAGQDQTTIVGSYAVFDPTNSKGDYNWYEWQQDEANPEEVKLFSQSKDTKDEWNIQKVGFIKEGVYRFRLIVRSGVTPGNMSGTSASEPDEVVVTVNPNPYIHFEDSNLEIMVRITLNKRVEELTGSTLLDLDSLQFLVTPQLVSSLSGLESCRNLYYLHMGSQDISDISPLSSLTKLKELTLDQNYKISDITPLRNLTALEWLNLSNNLITDISALEDLIKLKYLNLRYNNRINDISSLSNMIKLEELKMAKASLIDLSPIQNLTNLKILWFTSCGISDISYLKKLTNLINLKISWSNINSLSSLSNMKKLEWIALEMNNVADITPLKDLPNLRYIRLWDNQITDIKPLVDNPGIGDGDIVGLDDNPLDEKSINEYIPALQARGVQVTW
ncbi:MAG: leucine-rich repeat domain-containing protein [bacterium]